MKAVVISGGGNRGAGGAGKLYRLNKDYDFGIGVSTGALLVSLILLGKHDKIKEAYTTTTQEDIFDKGCNPFNKKGNLKLFNAILRTVRMKRSLGESYALFDRIKKFFTISDFNELKMVGKVAIVGVYNETLQQIEYKASNDIGMTYDKFVTWMWISANQPPAMTLAVMDGMEYCDGGVSDVFPMEEAVLRGADFITGILHRPMYLPMRRRRMSQNLLHRIARLHKAERKEIENKDIVEGVKACREADIPYELHFVSQGYGENDLIFDTDKMKSWWEDAFKEELNPISDYPIPKYKTK